MKTKRWNVKPGSFLAIGHGRGPQRAGSGVGPGARDGDRFEAVNVFFRKVLCTLALRRVVFEFEECYRYVLVLESYKYNQAPECIRSRV